MAAAMDIALSTWDVVVQKQSGMVMSKWLSERNITSPMMSELIKNARECGWHRPLVSRLKLFTLESFKLPREVAALC